MNLQALEDQGFDIEIRNHARAILCRDFPHALRELCSTLADFRIDARELIRGGGGESQPTQRLRRALANLSWTKQTIEVEKKVDGRITSSSTHEIDHVRRLPAGVIALEIEWNNKDPFFDRDLENFQRLHGDRAISVGIIITRGASLQRELSDLIRRTAIVDNVQDFDDLRNIYESRPTDAQQKNVERRLQRQDDSFVSAWSHVFTQSKFGAATTHWEKLLQRVDRGVGGACPALLLGIPASTVQLPAGA